MYDSYHYFHLFLLYSIKIYQNLFLAIFVAVSHCSHDMSNMNLAFAGNQDLMVRVSYFPLVYYSLKSNFEAQGFGKTTYTSYRILKEFAGWLVVRLFRFNRFFPVKTGSEPPRAKITLFWSPP